MSLILVISGPNKTAKTTLALSAVSLGPLKHYDLDLGYERASHRFEGKAIESKRYAVAAQGIEVLQGKVKLRSRAALHGIRELWDELVVDYITALQDDKYITHVFDTSSQMWEICHRGYLQELQEAQVAEHPGTTNLRASLMPVEYGEPNARMRALVYSARTYNRNLILTHYLKPEYQDVLTEKGKESMDTGRLIMDGYKHTIGLCDIAVSTFLRENVPYCRIDFCGLDLRVQGMELKEPTWDSIMGLISKMRAL